MGLSSSGAEEGSAPLNVLPGEAGSAGGAEGSGAAGRDAEAVADSPISTPKFSSQRLPSVLCSTVLSASACFKCAVKAFKSDSLMGTGFGTSGSLILLQVKTGLPALSLSIENCRLDLLLFSLKLR